MTGAAGAPPPADGFRRVRTVLLAALFGALFLALTRPAFGPDFWWHLATGRWMWEHGALPRADPFAFTATLFAPPAQGDYLLTLTWLSQALLYGVHLLAGLRGDALLQAAVFTGLFVLLFRLLRRTGVGTLAATLLLALAVQAIVRELAYVENRPQMWSSLFFVALLQLLERLREGRRRAAYLLPPLLLLWANLHGGYILGVAVLALTSVEALVSRHGERRRILVAAVAAIVLTGVNPAGYETLIAYPRLRLSGSGAFLTGVLEEASLFTYVGVAALPRAMPALAALFLLPLLSLVPRLGSLRRERRDLFLVYLLTLAMGIKAQRHLVFMVPMACLTTALNLAAVRERLGAAGQRLLSRRPAAWVLRAGTVVVLLALTASYARAAARGSLLRPSAAYHHEAEGAADYLARSGVAGNLFNEYAMGGYLAWRLEPALKVFVYGRLVNPELLALYNEMMYEPVRSASLTGTGRVRYFYESVLDGHAVDTVVVPAGDARSGDLVPLAVKLAQNDDWALVQADPAALVFLRRTPGHASLVAAALPKSAVYDAMIALAEGASGSSHGRAVPVWRRTIAYARYLQGHKLEALRLFDDYLQRSPEDTSAVEMRAGIAAELGAEAGR